MILAMCRVRRLWWSSSTYDSFKRLGPFSCAVVACKVPVGVDDIPELTSEAIDTITLRRHQVFVASANFRREHVDSRSLRLSRVCDCSSANFISQFKAHRSAKI